jgi:hypothetical protein
MTWQVRKEPRKKESDELSPVLMTVMALLGTGPDCALAQATRQRIQAPMASYILDHANHANRIRRFSSSNQKVSSLGLLR